MNLQRFPKSARNSDMGCEVVDKVASNYEEKFIMG